MLKEHIPLRKQPFHKNDPKMLHDDAMEVFIVMEAGGWGYYQEGIVGM